MVNRQAKRNLIQVGIEVAHTEANRCYGYAEHISPTGVSIVLQEGELPPRQRSVVLNFKIWTGSETLYRKIYARVLRSEQDRIALEFSRPDFTVDWIIHDLMFYQRNQDRTDRLQRNSDRFIQHELTA
ncbi:MAG: PilZ domain-containing protein [Thiogranum sp.]